MFCVVAPHLTGVDDGLLRFSWQGRPGSSAIVFINIIEWATKILHIVML